MSLRRKKTGSRPGVDVTYDHCGPHLSGHRAPDHHPVIEKLSGTSSVPFGFSPRSMTRAETPIEGIRTLAGRTGEMWDLGWEELSVASG